MLTLVQVSVGTPAPLGKTDETEVRSSIVKQRVEAPFVHLGPMGIIGDEQADQRVIRGKRVHGGPLKAVYAYPLEHLALWTAELPGGVSPGSSFGENLTVTGATEEDVQIGDEFCYGDVVLQVTSPRRPCYKLGLHMGEDIPRRMMANGRCGWYFKVVSPGELPTTGITLDLIGRVNGAQTVAEAFAEKVRREPAIPGPPS